ncbi:MAG: MarR family transcriptional regulator [Deltaproteobacteria bacterium HGW-Deltaproteobacteria-8]|nr:MAG: MarR family transcriptional regulator [Deltaproteobacteria bacterium HGW-Deltaproteobacteria-8]
MQQSVSKSIPSPDIRRCSEALLALAPTLMQSLRAGMRNGRGPELSVPQFRVLVHVCMRPGATLRHLAELLGVSTATTSRMVETLVLRGLLVRKPGEADRRQVSIALTRAGQAMLDQAHILARAQFETRLADLDAASLTTLSTALELLHGLFESERTPWTALDEHPEHDPEERS